MLDELNTIDDGWHKEFHLDELDGKALDVALDIRLLLDKRTGGLNPHEFKVACDKHWNDECPDPKEDCKDCQTPSQSRGCVSGCKLFRKSTSFAYSTGGHSNDIKYHTTQVNGLFSLIFDGGTLWDFLSINGDSAYLFPESHNKLKQSIEEVAAKHGCVVEDTTSWCMTFYEDE